MFTHIKYLWIGVIAGLVLGSSLTMAGASQAEATTRDIVRCSALWMNDHTDADEDRCRDKGWQVRPRYIISASGDKMWTGLGPCATEDSRGCYWNAAIRGNKCGFGFIQMRRLGTFTHLVKINGRWASKPCPRCGPQH